jgi:DNA-binding ferritin-like protein (Dps family)
MGISEFTSKVIGDKKRWRQYKDRTRQLPESYQTAIAGLERYINHLGGMGDADAIMAMLDDLADLFEQAAAQGTAIREIVGEDPVEFIQTFLRNYPAGRWITREEDRLKEAVSRAEAQQAGLGEAST